VLFAVTYVFGSNQGSQLFDLPTGGYTMRLELVTSGQAASVARAAAAGAGPLTTGHIDSSTAFAQVPLPTAQRQKASTSTKRTTASRRK
jgi:hypothetical protein